MVRFPTLWKVACNKCQRTEVRRGPLLVAASVDKYSRVSCDSACMAANIIAADGLSFERKGLLRELNPGPLAPEARIIPLDQAADEC